MYDAPETDPESDEHGCKQQGETCGMDGDDSERHAECTARLAASCRSAIQYHRVKSVLPQTNKPRTKRHEGRLDISLRHRWAMFLMNLGLEQFKTCFATPTAQEPLNPLAGMT